MAQATVVHGVPLGPDKKNTNNMAPPMPPMQHYPSQQVMSFNEGGAREFLSSSDFGNNWPRGLQDTFIRSITKVPIRYFIVDDSGSMAASDGHKLHKKAFDQQVMIGCSRWTELGDSVRFHMKLAHAARAPSEFRLLNGAPPILIGGGDPNELMGMQMLESAFNESPNGGTPLCRHIGEIVAKIQSLESFLRQSGQVACIVIMTDGESSDGNLAQAMAPLKALPVHVVIRLCTDQEKVVEYWNNVDNELELQMDVLDDLTGEAQEVTEKNGWFTYGEPIHRLREFGVTVKEFDLMDEIQLSMDQMSRVCRDIYGGDVKRFPPPEADWKGFIKAIDDETRMQPKVWCPITQKMQPWILKSKLSAIYHPGGCVIM